MSADALPLPLPTLPGYCSGIVAVDKSGGPGRHVMTVQCSGCYATKTDTSLFAASFALFPGGAHGDGVRLCEACRKACGCLHCERTWW
jgi:hypothetical protein